MLNIAHIAVLFIAIAQDLKNNIISTKNGMYILHVDNWWIYRLA